MSEAREWIQWSVPMIGKMVCVLIGALTFVALLAWEGYSDHDSRIYELELRAAKHDLILEQISRDVVTIKEYVIAKEERTKDFYAKRPVFWDDLEHLFDKRGDGQ